MIFVFNNSLWHEFSTSQASEKQSKEVYCISVLSSVAHGSSPKVVIDVLFLFFCMNKAFPLQKRKITLHLLIKTYSTWQYFAGLWCKNPKIHSYNKCKK